MVLSPILLLSDINNVVKMDELKYGHITANFLNGHEPQSRRGKKEELIIVGEALYTVGNFDWEATGHIVKHSHIKIFFNHYSPCNTESNVINLQHVHTVIILAP